MERAFLCVTDDHYWAIFAENSETPLVYGRSFEPGEAIYDAVAELETWAASNGYILTPPLYGVQRCALEDLIEPEIYAEVFG